MSRLLTAAVAVPVLTLLILKGPAWSFLAVAMAGALVAYWELTGMMRGLLGVGYLGTALLVASFYWPSLSFLHAALAALLLVGCSVVFSRVPDRDNLEGVLGTVFAVFYVGALVGSLVGLRMLEPDPSGRQWVIFVFAVVYVGDAGAYYVGKSVGKHALAPRLSPKKTIEGLGGDVVFACACAVALNAWWFPGWPLLVAMGLGLLLSLLGVIGDLFESFLKRAAGVKDASALIPGHGGVLDRIDSVLFAAPALLICAWWVS